MSQSKNHRLSDAEKTYLRSGETGSYSESRMQDRIQEKQASIGSRLNELIKDISIIHGSEVYDSENNRTNFFEDLYFPVTLTESDIELIRKDKRKNADDEQFKIVETPKTGEEFGFFIGGVIHILLAMMPNEVSWKSILCGLCHSYVTVAGQGKPDRLENARRIDFFEQIEKISDRGYRSSGASGEYEYLWGYETPSGVPWKADTKKLLNRKKIPSTSFLQSYLADVQNWGDEVVAPPPEILSSRLSLIMGSPRFSSTIELHKQIISDISRLGETFRGPNRLDILKEIYCCKSKIKSSKIATNLGESSSTHLVTSALNRMSDEVDDSRRWIPYAVSKKCDDRWELTPYGYLLTMYISGKISKSEIHRYAVRDQDYTNEQSETIISEALNQISND